MNVAFNRDCMEVMKEYPDKYFDLAVVDPPYGGGSQSVQVERGLTGGTADYEHRPRSRFGGKFDSYHISDTDRRDVEQEVPKGTTGAVGADVRHWDIAPQPEYFDELARVSKNQIIFGGNYFDLPPTRGFIIYRKLNIPLEGFSMSPVEYAWTSFNMNAQMFEAYANGKPGEPRFHPTQKPVELYRWILTKFAQEGDRVIDTHLGSGSSRIAAYDLGFDFVGCETDPYYFKLEEERFAAYTAQTSLFRMEET